MAREPNPPTPTPHDATYKAFFSLIPVIKSLFVHMAKVLGLDPEIIKLLDFDKAEVLSPESISKKFKRRTNDLFIRIPSLCIPIFDGIPLMDDLYIVIEFQAWPHPRMAKRMMKYIKAMFRWLMRGAKPTDRPPQLMAFVLYHGKPPWRGPRGPLVSIYDNNRPGMQFRGTHPERRLNLQTLDVTGMPEDGLVPALCRIEQAEDFETVRSVLKTIFTKHSEPSDDAVCKALYDRAAVIGWFWRDKEKTVRVPYREARRKIVGDIPMPEIVTTIDQMLYDSGRKGERRGLRKGERRGLRKGLARQRELLCRLAAKQFDAATAGELETLLEAIDDQDVLDEIGESIIGCESGRELINVCRGLGSPH